LSIVGPALFLTALVRPGVAQRCDDLVSLKLEQASVTSATMVPAAEPKDPGATAALRVPAHCQVKAVARPTNDSEIEFEVWLPAADVWNGNFEQIGNGGYAGSINSTALGAGVARGFVTAATDDGHHGPAPTFALGHPEKVVDFGHRAVHLTAVHAKAIAAAAYGRAPGRAYFLGCSDGGREALMEAQRYPTDFNGILAGAPANDWTRLLTSGVWNWKAMTETPASAIPPAKLLLIQRAVATACDATDGVKDGLIDDPTRCRFDPKRLLCRGADGPDCLTSAEVATLGRVYGGPKSPKTGKQIFPGAAPGVEAVRGNWDAWLVGSGQGLPLQAWFGTTFYQNMVFEDPKWDYHAIDFDRDLATALGKVGPILDATNPDLSPFRDRGGKLIQFHGWGDAAIPGYSSIEYYEHVRAKLAGGKPAVDDFYRLFMVPGMGHCAGGIGPGDFGNLGLLGTSSTDPERDIHAALVRWVEQGVAPDRLIAKGVRPTDPPNDPSKGAPITRLLCPYPSRPQYRGTGSTDSAESFACAATGGGSGSRRTTS
jgi:feruloyl esterase